MTAPLRFSSAGRFKIAQIADAHFCDGSMEDARTLDLIERVLDAERPDFVALTGDFVDGSRSADPASAWRRGVAPIEARAIPWAAVFGNHDDEGSADRATLLEAQQACDHCLSVRGPETLSGTGNFVLPVGSADGAEAAAAHLYFFDSGSYSATGAGVYAWIAHDQVAWYRESSRRLRGGRTAPLPALAFLHIPLPEYETAWDEGTPLGSKLEGVCCPRVNSGLFAAFHELGEVSGVFCGHDHANDFEASRFGVRLCYGRATGYNTYGAEGFARGARIIELREGSRDFETWLRLDGESETGEEPRRVAQSPARAGDRSA